MAGYRVMVVGTRFRRVDGAEGQTFGFYVNVFVTAGSSLEAEAAAIAAVSSRDDLQQQLQQSLDRPQLAVEEVVESNEPISETRLPGLAWFPDTES